MHSRCILSVGGKTLIAYKHKKLCDHAQPEMGSDLICSPVILYSWLQSRNKVLRESRGPKVTPESALPYCL